VTVMERCRFAIKSFLEKIEICCPNFYDSED
jgi:hypothetical protein